METINKKQLTLKFEAHRLRGFMGKVMHEDKQYFECLSCGRESELVASPAKCSDCGSGSGIISPQSRAQREMAQREASHETFRRAAQIAKGKVS
jgi:Zn finger protein HypA/HybF involved in hydrogenase expression